MTDTSGIVIHSAQAEVVRYNSGRGMRCFCPGCGSPLWFESLDFPEMSAIPLGVLDSDDIQAPVMHIWTRSMPVWSSIDDDLPQYPEYP